MAGFSDSGKIVAWRRRFRRFGTAGTTVVRLCEKEGVSTASFYRGRKRLADRPTTHDADARRKHAAEDAGRPPVFQTVRIATPDAPIATLNAPIAIHLPGDVRIDVPTEDLDAVRAVLGEVLQHGALQNREDTPC
jgi:hypothetical protein